MFDRVQNLTESIREKICHEWREKNNPSLQATLPQHDRCFFFHSRNVYIVDCMGIKLLNSL